MAEAGIAATAHSEERTRPRILRNVFSNWTCYAISLAVNFFLSPFVVHHLGNAGYGVWTLLTSLTGYLGLLDFGVRGAVTRYVVKFHTIRNDEDASKVASSGLLIFSAAGMLGIVLASGLALFAIPRFHLPLGYQATARIVVILAGANIAVSLVSGTFGGVVAALQRFDALNGVEILVTGLRAVTIVTALSMGRSLITLACIHLAFSAFRGLVNLILSKKLYPELRFAFSNADSAHARLILSLSFYVFLTQISAEIIHYTDTLVIGAFLPVALVTFFIIGGNLVDYTRALLAGISHTISPFASQLEAKGDVSGLRKAVLVSCRFGTAVTLPILVTCMIRGDTFIGLWMGSQYAETSGHILRILAVMMFFYAGIYQVGPIMLAVGKHKPLALARGGEAIANLVLSILWVKTIGLPGVAWGTTVPSIAFSVGFWPWYIHRALGISPFRFMYSCWLRPWLSIVPFAFVTYFFEKFWSAAHLSSFLLQVVTALPVALGGIWFGCIDREQRQKYASGFACSMVHVFSRS